GCHAATCSSACLPLPAEAAPHRGGHNMALDNIRQRLEAHYGSQATLDIDDATPGEFVVRLALPQPTEAGG
ncbi:MAG: hypothetical protein V2J89_15010, partial [Halieaceae bacterium]|nr:hypothetical protein [Halieaceae bacterium]